MAASLLPASYKRVRNERDREKRFSQTGFTIFYSSGIAIRVTNGEFAWDRAASSVLENINLNIGIGNLIAITGPVGSGKSSLISGIVGEMYLKSGSAQISVRRFFG